MNNNERDPLHEKLCAFVLGEATPEEAREVEAELLRSSEFAAERERLQATIATVRRAFGEPEALSPRALEAVLARAAQGTAPGAAQATARGSGARHGLRATTAAWSSASVLRAAAAVTLLLGGVLGTLRLAEQQRADRPSRALEVGRLEGDRAGERSLLDALQEAPADGTRAAAHAWRPNLSLDPGASIQVGSGPDRGGSDLQAEVAGSGEHAELDSAGALGAPSVALSQEDAVRVPWLAEVELPERDAWEGLKKERSQAAQGEGQAAGEPAPTNDPRLLLLSTETASAPDAQAGMLELGVEIGFEHVKAIEQPPSTPERRMAGAVATPESRTELTGSDDFFLGHGTKEQAQDAPSAPSGATVPEFRLEAADDVLRELSAAPREKNLRYDAGDIETLKGLGYLGEDEDKDARAIEHLAELGYGDDSEDEDKAARGLERQHDHDNNRRLDDDELRRRSIDLRTRCVDSCRRRPNEAPRDMYFRYWGDNPFEDATRDRLSTFGVDVDTASYALARRYLRDGFLPTRAQVRTEEFVNYFSPDLTAPAEGTFAITSELAPSRFGGAGGERWMLRVAIRGREVPRTERSPLSLTFVVDVSGSMKEGQRLELVKHAIRLLVAQLDARDAVGIVAFSSEARLVLPLTSVAQRDLIETALQPLAPDGSTNAEAGLKLGYQLALTGLDPAHHSRVVFLSDGVANVGETDQERITRDVAKHRAKGIYLNTIGVGMNNHNDVLLEQLADKGDGICDYVDDAASAQRAIVERFTGAMIPIASDVKVQVDFDPARVRRYRLLGYENRAIADQDFRNDAIDAGEVGSGHQVVALYELELAPERDGTPLAQVHLRWKEPKAAGQHPAEVTVRELALPVAWRSAVAAFASASPGFRRAALAAQFAECLRVSSHAVEDSLLVLFEEARALAASQGDAESQELADLIARAIELGLQETMQRSALEAVLDEYRRQQIQQARLEELRRSLETEQLREELRLQNDQLERRLEELILEELRRKNG